MSRPRPSSRRPAATRQARHAADWLRDTAPSYAAPLAEGFLPGYESTRSDFYFLARDLGTMLEVATEALAEDRDVPVEREDAASEDPTAPLARIVAFPSGRWEEVTGHVLGVAYEELREELLQRCEAEALSRVRGERAQEPQEPELPSGNEQELVSTA